VILRVVELHIDVGGLSREKATGRWRRLGWKERKIVSEDFSGEMRSVQTVDGSDNVNEGGHIFRVAVNYALPTVALPIEVLLDLRYHINL
jgi:hypothetical protein